MTDQSKPYTPLTADNSALVLVDHQVGLMTGVRDYETGELKHNVVALAAGGNRDGRGGGEAENGGSVNWAFMRPMLNAPRATGCSTRSPRTRSSRSSSTGTSGAAATSWCGTTAAPCTR